MEPGGKALVHGGARGALGGPRGYIDPAGLHQFEGAMVFGRSGVAAGEDRGFAAVEIGIEQRDMVVDEADEDQLTALLEQLDGLLHGAAVAGAIEDEHGGLFLTRFVVGRVGSRQRVVPGGEVEALGHFFNNAERSAGQLEEFHHGEADGAGTDDDGAFPGLGIGAADGVDADTERFDQGDLDGRQLLALVHLFRGKQNAIAHPAIGMDSDDAHLRAAIGASAGAGGANAAGHIGVDGAAVAGLKAGNIVAGADHLDGEFVAQDAGVGEEGLGAFEGMEVRAADSDHEDADQDFTGSRRIGLRGTGVNEAARLFESDGVHEFPGYRSMARENKGSRRFGGAERSRRAN